MTEKQFTTLSVRKVFFKLALPNIFSMVFSSIYMMIDGIFVGRFIGEHALAAINLIMPVMMIVFALSNMIAVGSGVKVATALGEGKSEKARQLFSASVMIILGLGIIFSIFGILLAKPIIYAMIKDVLLAEMAYQYIRVFAIGLSFIMPLFAMDNFLRVCGKAKYSMWVNIVVSVLNIVLDWLFIAKLGLGIEYSAMASVASMLLGVLCSFIPFFTKKITLYFIKPQISMSEMIGIVYNGSSEFFSSVASSFMTTAINVLLIRFGGAVAVASYGIVMYIDTLLVGMLYGVLDAVQPAVSYNLGAGEVKRTFSFFRISCISTGILSGICMIVILVYPQTLAGAFTKGTNGEVVHMTIAALLLFAPSYLFTWFNMVTSAFLTAMDKPKESMIIMTFKAIVFPILCLLLLPSILGVYGVFLTASVSGALTFVIAFFIWRKAAKQLKKVKHLQQSADIERI
ncbi:MAG: MATE family efflux transporter [Lachnospiraceae bacterium]